MILQRCSYNIAGHVIAAYAPLPADVARCSLTSFEPPVLRFCAACQGPLEMEFRVTSACSAQLPSGSVQHGCHTRAAAGQGSHSTLEQADTACSQPAWQRQRPGLLPPAAVGLTRTRSMHAGCKPPGPWPAQQVSCADVPRVRSWRCRCRQRGRMLCMACTVR
jgi:hypothetical protein